MSNKNKKIVQGEEDEEEDDLYDDYDDKPKTTTTTTTTTTSTSTTTNSMNKSDSNISLNKEMLINDHPEDLIVGANSPLNVSVTTTPIENINENPSPVNLDEQTQQTQQPQQNSISPIPQLSSSSSSSLSSLSSTTTTTITNSAVSPSNILITPTQSPIEIKPIIETQQPLPSPPQQGPSPIILQQQQNQQPLQSQYIPQPIPQPQYQPIASQQSQQPQQPPTRKFSGSQMLPQRIPLSLGENKLKEFNENLRKSYCTKTHMLYYSINKEVSGANQHLTGVIDLIKSVQHNIRQYNDDILTLEEKLEQTEWSLQC
ncbi:hypothetical protein ACTFIR_003339 [Dictyostelium discoideum]